MGTSFLTQWLSDHEIKAICWTLIHSLWIGLIIAALAGLVIAFTKKASSRMRYRLLCGVLVLFVLSSGFTFYLELTNGRHTLSIANHVPAISGNLTVVNVNEAGVKEISFINRTITFLNQQSGWIFFVWLICFAVKSVKMAGGLFYVHHIRYNKVHLIDEEWERKVLSFSKKLGIHQKVVLLQSELIKVPVTIGFFKPVILLPLGLVLQLPPGQVDTILWHELAHIIRRDYLVNILQGIVETVFFFNPALLWLSALIREEREACCDDMVLANVIQKGSYLQALLSFHEYADSSMGHAMALGLGRNQLKNRFKRMVDLENKKLSVVEKVILLLGIVMLSAFTIVPKTNLEIKHTATLLKKNILAIMVKASNNNNNDRPQITAVRPKLTPLIVNYQVNDKIITHSRLSDSLIAADTAIKFTSIRFLHNSADSVNHTVQVMDNKGNRYYFKTINNQLVFMEINGKAIKNEDLAKYQGFVAQVNQSADQLKFIKYKNIVKLSTSEQQNRNNDLALQNEIQLRKLQKISIDKNDSVKLRFYKIKVMPTPKLEIKIRKELALRGDTNPTKKEIQDEIYFERKKAVDEVVIKGRVDAKINQKVIRIQKKSDSLRKVRDTLIFKKRAFNKKNDSLYFRRQEAEQRIVKEEMKSIITDLINANVVKDKNSLSWFGLTETELIVNGVKQPEEIQKRLAEKYIRNPRFGFYYGPVQMYGMGYFYGKNDL
ncbi:beta-lactamase regulating signal transducer with metallopeptidase domain [Mucilaginibacter frigoritolerans]|uniref:Beta-lactamase regulating signal transducer with metallopeptidase domain n=1 Tax=Mucilaginibacter frigoritolerans TaxID=652788 RepID=A0A562TYY9_9SPHI|nr:M56 family metallopeptidase [Mucilaginibacter frigoritolerans]TWI98841.1 beta-lactamase regulating signal transducer with metallopeptidase domain [Mucilaginibacter frigoritolerans]